MNKRTKACDISQKTKKIVWERDGHCCILCGTPMAKPNAHYIPRSDGGLGIEQNVVTLCLQCHHDTDQTVKRNDNLAKIRAYLMGKYEDWDEESLRYKKYGV